MQLYSMEAALDARLETFRASQRTTQVRYAELVALARQLLATAEARLSQSAAILQQPADLGARGNPPDSTTASASAHRRAEI
jgi:hypothetical protein